MLFALFFLLLLYLKDLFFGFDDNPVWLNSTLARLANVFDGKLSAMISMIVVLVNGILIYKINFDHISISGREHLLVWLWVVQVGGFSFFHPLSETHFAVTFILLSCNSLFKIYRNTEDYKSIYLSSMYLGIATMFYSFAIYLFIPYIISLYRFKIAGLRDWIISISGFLVPFYFAIFVFHFSRGNWLYPIESTLDNIIPERLSMEIVEMQVSQYIFFGLIFGLTFIERLMSIKQTNRGLNQKTISCMRSFSNLLFFSTLLFLLFTPDSKFVLQIIFISTTVYLRILFVRIKRNIVANSLLLLLVTVSIISMLIEN
jgi:hypothetical protein